MPSSKAPFSAEPPTPAPESADEASDVNTETSSKKASLSVSVVHAFGVRDATLSQVGVVTIENADRAVYAVGKHLAVYGVEDGAMAFAKGRNRSSGVIEALCVSDSTKLACVAERDAKANADGCLVVYSLVTLKIVGKRVSYGAHAATALAFSQDAKVVYVATKDFLISTLNLETEAFALLVNAAAPVSKITAFPGRPERLIVTSGPTHLRLWTPASNGTLKGVALNHSDAALLNCVDHVIFLASETAVVSSTAATYIIAVMRHESAKKSGVYIFDASDIDAGIPQLNAIFSKDGGGVPTAVATFSKGFLVVGTHGLLAVYEHSNTQISSGVKPSVRKGEQSNFDSQKGKSREKDVHQHNRFLLLKNARHPHYSFCGIVASRSDEVALVVTTAKTLLFLPLSNIDLTADLAYSVKDLHPNGYHTGGVVAADCCLQKPLLLTCSRDGCARVFDVFKKCCKVAHDFGAEEPLSVALHPNGFQCVVGFRDRGRVFFVLRDSLKYFADFYCKSCRVIKYSPGGNVFAASNGTNLAVYDSYTLANVATVTGHVSPIKDVAFESNVVVYTTSTDGNTIGYNLYTQKKMEEPSLMYKSGGFVGVTVEVANGDNHAVVASATDGKLRRLCWQRGHDSVNMKDFDIGAGMYATCLALPPKRKVLLAGTSSGALRVYPKYPSPVEVFEVQLHSAPVKTVLATSDGTMVYSAAEDGSIFLTALNDGTNGSDLRLVEMDTELVLEDTLQESATALADLREKIEELNVKQEMNLKLRETQWEEQLRKTVVEKDASIIGAKEATKELGEKYDKALRSHSLAMETLQETHVREIRELETQYEHKIAFEMERFDKLSEEVEAVQQRCQSLLASQSESQEHLVRSLEAQSRQAAAELQLSQARVEGDAKHNQLVFKEILEQQEHEYESELQTLCKQYQEEIGAERENTARMRSKYQTLHTKLEQLRKKFEEMKSESAARNKLLLLEKAKNKSLESTVLHFQRHLSTREEALRLKEKALAALRSENKTLENFRFVLDNRLTQLVDERAPFATRIHRLEDLIKNMYDELVVEFRKKQNGERELNGKDMKISGLSREASNLRTLIRERERTIASMNRDIAGLVHIHNHKDLEVAVKVLYRKLVKNEDVRRAPTSADIRTETLAAELRSKRSNDSEDSGDERESAVNGAETSTCPSHKEKALSVDGSLAEKALEVCRQRDFIQQKNKRLKRRLVQSATEGAKEHSRLLAENSSLIKECNELRKERHALRANVVALTQRSTTVNQVSVNQPTLNPLEDILEEPRKSAMEVSLVPTRQQPGDSSSRASQRGSLSRGHPRTAEHAKDAQIHQLRQQLDSSSREVAMQKMEITRLRDMLRKVGSTAPSTGFPSVPPPGL